MHLAPLVFALDSMRIEKGYRTWKGDLSTDYTLLEGGLERFVRLNKEQNFPGKQALMSEKQQGAKKGFVTLVVEVDDDGANALGQHQVHVPRDVHDPPGGHHREEVPDRLPDPRHPRAHPQSESMQVPVMGKEVVIKTL